MTHHKWEPSPFFMKPVVSEHDLDLVVFTRTCDGLEESRVSLLGSRAVPESEEIPEDWLAAMPESWRRKLEARAAQTGALNLWTLSAVTGVPTWRLRARLQEESARWRVFADAVEVLSQRLEEEEKNQGAA